MEITYNGRRVISRAVVTLSENDVVVVDDGGYAVEIVVEVGTSPTLSWSNPTPDSSRITVSADGTFSMWSSLSGDLHGRSVAGYFSAEYLARLGDASLYRVSFVIHEA